MGSLWEVLYAVRVRDVVDIAIVAYLLYRTFLMFKGTLALQMLAGLGVLMVARFVSRQADLHSLSFILDNFWAFWVLALIVLFQPELRRTLAQAGRSRLLQRVFREGPAGRQQVPEEVARAVEALAAKRIGALIAVERSGGLRTYAELGVPMDAAVSAELLGSLFQPGSPLHDGAVILQGDRIAAAGCFLPLSRNLQLARTLGTRHRAALGLSEETGAISLAVEGSIERGFDAGRLGARLLELVGGGEAAAPGSRWLRAGVRRLTVREKA